MARARERAGGIEERERERKLRRRLSRGEGVVEKANIGTMVFGDSGRGKWARAVLVVVAGRAVAQHEIPSDLERASLASILERTISRL